MSNLLDSLTTGLVPQTIGIEEFAESSAYCDKALFPRQTVLLKLIFLEEMTGPEEDILSEWINSEMLGGEVLLSPHIRERRDYLRERGYRHFREIQLVGGRRSSKGFCTGISLAKQMWDTLQLGDPHEYYGIDAGREIFFSCVAASESQAKEFQYGDFVSTVETCKGFEPYFQKSLETEFRVASPSDLRKISAARSRGNKIQRDIAKLRGKALAANAGTLRGSATMAIALDEMAHMTVGESKASAEEVYKAAIPSINQFALDGLIFANSSPYTKVGKFYEIFEVAMRPFQYEAAAPDILGEDNTDPRGFSIEFPSWELYKGYMKYKSRWKQRTRGRELGKMPTVSPDWDPNEVDAQGDSLYSTEDKGLILGQRLEEAKNPESFKVEQRGQFAEVVDAFLNPAMVDQMYAGLPAGLDAQPDGTFTKSFTPLYTNRGTGALNTYRYKFHLDPSSTTAGFGFAIAHIEHLVNASTGDTEEHCVFDLIQRWDPKSFPGRVIRWKPILDEVAMLADIFRPYEITMDQHQSAEPIQTLQEMLTKRNIVCQVYEKVATNEINWKRWQVLKTAIYQGLVHAPYDEVGTPTSQNELKFLQEMPTGGKFPKVEKQDIGPVRTKDQADCYDDQTEVLTELGWMLFKDVPDGVKLATRDKDGVLEYHLPTKRIERHAEEIMVYETNRLNFAVTPGHRMLVTADRGSKESFIRADDLKADIYRVPKTALLVGSDNRFLTNAEAKIIGFWLADGRKCKPYDNHQGIRLTQTKPDGVAWVDSIVGDLGTPVNRFVQANGEIVWHISSRRLRNICTSMQQSEEELRIPQVILTSPELGRACLEGLLVGDGVWSSREQRYAGFWNTSERLIDDVQVLLAHLGQCGRKIMRRPKGTSTSEGVISKKDLWYLHIDLKPKARLFTQRIQRVPYSGMVYCFTVPNSTLLVRRNGVMMWCGNCIAECVYSLIGNLMATRMRDRLATGGAFGAPGGYGIGSGGPVGGNGPPGISEYYAQRDQKILSGRINRGDMAFDRASLTRSALGGRGNYRGSRSRGR